MFLLLAMLAYVGGACQNYAMNPRALANIKSKIYRYNGWLRDVYASQFPRLFEERCGAIVKDASQDSGKVYLPEWTEEAQSFWKSRLENEGILINDNLKQNPFYPSIHATKKAGFDAVRNSCKFIQSTGRTALAGDGVYTQYYNESSISDDDSNSLPHVLRRFWRFVNTLDLYSRPREGDDSFRHVILCVTFRKHGAYREVKKKDQGFAWSVSKEPMVIPLLFWKVPKKLFQTNDSLHNPVSVQNIRDFPWHKLLGLTTNSDAPQRPFRRPMPTTESRPAANSRPTINSDAPQRPVERPRPRAQDGQQPASQTNVDDPSLDADTPQKDGSPASSERDNATGDLRSDSEREDSSRVQSAAKRPSKKSPTPVRSRVHSNGKKHQLKKGKNKRTSSVSRGPQASQGGKKDEKVNSKPSSESSDDNWLLKLGGILIMLMFLLVAQKPNFFRNLLAPTCPLLGRAKPSWYQCWY